MTSTSKKLFGRTSALLAVAASFVAIDVAPAFAQLETVTVTARKREEDIRNIPIAVTAVGTQEMEKFNLKNLEAVTDLVPQLMISRTSSGNAATISIRGISSNSSSIGIEQSVAVILDGIYYGQGRVINDGLLDSSQVEILKGPQALFFGKNATAGVINIRTNDPGDEREYMGRVGFEFDSEQLYTEAVASAPINEKFGLRIAARYSKMFGGWFANDVAPGTYNRIGSTPIDVAVPSKLKWPGQEDFIGRLTMLFTPSDDLTIRLKGQYSSYSTISTTGLRELTSCPATGTSQVQPGLACTRDWRTQENPFPVDMAATNPLINKKDGDLFDEYYSYSLTGDIEYSSDLFDITTALNYQYLRNEWGGDFDSSGLPSVYAGEDTTYRAFSAEFRALSKFEGPVNLVIGAYHQSSRRVFDQDVIFAGAFNPDAADPTDVYTAYEKNSETDGTTYSIFGQIIWSISDTVEFTGGARYHHERKNSYFDQPYVNPVFTGLFTQDSIDARQTWNDVSPEAALTWAVTDEYTIYVAYKQGFKSGGFSNSGILGAISGTREDFTFEDEQVEGFEGGIKGQLADNTFRFELDIFHYKYKDLQIDFFNSPTFAFITENAGSAETTGAEFQFDWAPEDVEGLILSGSVAYNDAHYVDFVAPCWAGQKPSQGCTIFNPGQAPKQQLAGFQRNLAPKWLLALTADYETPVSDKLVLGLTVNGQYRSKYATNGFGHPEDWQKGYFLMNASVRLFSEDESWQIAVIARNLTNAYAILDSGDSPSSGGGTGTEDGFMADRRSSVNRPRSVAVEATFRF